VGADRPDGEDEGKSEGQTLTQLRGCEKKESIREQTRALIMADDDDEQGRYMVVSLYPCHQIIYSPLPCDR